MGPVVGSRPSSGLRSARLRTAGALIRTKGPSTDGGRMIALSADWEGGEDKNMSWQDREQQGQALHEVG